MKRLLPFVLVMLALGAAAILHLMKPEAVRAPVTIAAVAVETEILQSESVFLTVESQGTVEPRTRTNLVSEVSGTILSVSDKFVVGGKFEAGELLLRVDPTDYQVALQRAEALLKGAEAQLIFEKARSAQAKKEWEFTGRPLSEAPLLALRVPYLAEAEANIEQAKAEVERARVKLEKTRIKAPYNGIISRKNVDIGQFVSAGIPLAETFAVDFVEIRLPLSDQDLSKMSDLDFTDALRGKKVNLLGFANGRSSSWEGRAERFERVVEQTNRSQYLVVRVGNPYDLKDLNSRANPLLVGTFVTADFVGRELPNVFKLRRSGLIQGDRVALIEANSRLKLVDVELTYADDNYYYVSGLDESSEIVTSSIGIPVDGMVVEVKNASKGESLSRG